MPLPVIGLIGLIEKPRLEDADFYLFFPSIGIGAKGDIFFV